jgi:soluble lytic murein transglycosylase
MLVKTAKRFANGANVTRELLQDPAKNLEIGSRFLGFLWKRFDAAAPLAIAGYNAGEGRSTLAARARRLAHGRVHGDDPDRRDAQLHQARAGVVFTYSWLYGDHPVPAVPLAARGKPEGSGRGSGKGDDSDGGKPSRAGRTKAARR